MTVSPSAAGQGERHEGGAHEGGTHEGGTHAQSADQDEKTYQNLRDRGESKEKSARIANAVAATSARQVGRKGGRSGSYDGWTKQDLLKRAAEIGIKGRSTMSKAELIKALRDH